MSCEKLREIREVTARLETWNRPAPEFARIEVEARLRRFLQELERSTREHDEEAVHDLRVSVRRFSQALRIFSPLLHARGVKKIRARLNAVMKASSVVRDLDVGMEFLKDLGIGEEEEIYVRMRDERRRAELRFIGQVCLLRADDLEAGWRARLGWSAE